MKIKKDDIVKIISGKDKNKTGKVLKAFPAKDQVVVENVNIKKKHQKANKGGKKGQIIEKTYPVHVSNVAFVDPKTKKSTKIGKKLVKDKYVRVSKKSGTVLS
jgi:large subunit ribosomal protein L24